MNVVAAPLCWCGGALGHRGRHRNGGSPYRLGEPPRARQPAGLSAHFSRPSGGSLRRFVFTHNGTRPSHAEASLAADNPALSEARTIFRRSVKDVLPGDDVLVSGHSNTKIGALVTKGAWAGYPIFTLTLEERATCPTSCDLWRQCYGNSMPLAKRWRYSPAFIASLEASLAAKNRRFAGFVVRLHVLGDFPDVAYADRWMVWLNQFPRLHVFGYTHHAPDSDIGRVIAHLNQHVPDRWRVRFSVPPTAEQAPLQATTIWRPEEARRRVPEGVICPMQRGATSTCGTCGLCWAPAADTQRIVFLGHGKTRRNGPVRDVEAKPVAPVVAPATDGAAWVLADLEVERAELAARLARVERRIAMWRGRP